MKSKIFGVLFALVLVLSSSLVTAVPALADSPEAVPLGAAANFAVLGGTAVTLTNSTITGDVGSTGSTITQTGSTTITGAVYEGSAAGTAYADFLTAYGLLAGEEVPSGHALTGNLANVTLLPGVYSFDIVGKTGTLTLNANGDANAVWIFKSAAADGYLVGTNFDVVMADNGKARNVFWWVDDYATLTTSHFQGTILAGAAITVTGGTFNGRALAKAAVTLTGATVSGCGSGAPNPPPTYGSIKVTGGGQISVPDPNSDDANATGTGKATFGFNAQPDKKGGTAKGEFNYVNHVTELHINGSVDKVVVIAANADGSPKTVLFSGTYEGGSFIVTVEDRGEPGTNDKFGVTVIGSQSEVRSMRVISNGNIQFHK